VVKGVRRTEARLAGVHAHLTGFVAVPFILLGLRSGFALRRMQNALSPRGNIVMPDLFE
jgi:hypothetical protein